MNYFPLLGIVVAVSGCAQHDYQPEFPALRAQARSICEIMAEPARYLGQRIMVRGTYVQDPHHTYLSDNDCPDWEFNIRGSRSQDNKRARRILRRLSRKYPTVEAPVVYLATFTSRPLITVCIPEPSCYTYHLEDAQLRAALPQSQRDKSK